MTDTQPDRGEDAAREPRPSAGLRLRIWLACLGGPLVAAAGIWWVVGTQTGPTSSVDVAALVSWLGAVAGLALIVGAAFALWLDRGIVAQARGLTTAVAQRRITALRGLPGSAGWGELSQLTQQIQQLVTSNRQAEQAAGDLGIVREQLARLREALDRWGESERWKDLRAEPGPVAPVVEALNQGLARLDEVREQNLEAARQIEEELQESLRDARGSAEQAERVFVEATALLTTVRELQRLGQELAQTIPGMTAEDAQAGAAWMRETLEELVEGSNRAVESLSNGMRQVEAIAAEVPVIANRATLVALNTAIGSRVAPEAEVAEESRRLALEVRAAAERTVRLERHLDEELGRASEAMRQVRERVAARLESMPRAASPTRLLERIREMVQDATRKGERLSASGERASRSAETLLRNLEAETRDMAGLLQRLSPLPEAGEAPAPAEPPGGPLRLLSEDDLVSDDDSGSAEEPR